MPTGFDKFKNKALKEEPIMLNSKPEEEQSPFEAMRRSAQAQEPQRPSRARGAAAGAERRRGGETQPHVAGRKRSGEELRDLVTVTVQLHEETKTRLDEMKFFQKRKLWELVDEAINDLYMKYNG